MTGTQWALLYLAVGACYIAARWHLTEHKIVAELRGISADNPDLPVRELGTVALLLLIVFLVLLWPVAATLRAVRTFRGQS